MAQIELQGPGASGLPPICDLCETHHDRVVVVAALHPAHPGACNETQICPDCLRAAIALLVLPTDQQVASLAHRAAQALVAGEDPAAGIGAQMLAMVQHNAAMRRDDGEAPSHQKTPTGTAPGSKPVSLEGVGLLELTAAALDAVRGWHHSPTNAKASVIGYLRAGGDAPIGARMAAAVLEALQ